jgi:hypothetical protein
MATVKLVHRDFDFEREFDETDAVEITQARAIGWTTKPELKAAERADKQADAK